MGQTQQNVSLQYGTNPTERFITIWDKPNKTFHYNMGQTQQRHLCHRRCHIIAAVSAVEYTHMQADMTPDLSRLDWIFLTGIHRSFLQSV
jgi:hypothetical protein